MAFAAEARRTWAVGPLQAAGDPVPFFELVLPARAAQAAIPVLAAVSVAGIVVVVVRH